MSPHLCRDNPLDVFHGCGKLSREWKCRERNLPERCRLVCRAGPLRRVRQFQNVPSLRDAFLARVKRLCSHRVNFCFQLDVLISLVSDILLAIILAGLENSILIRHNSTVNAGKQLTLFPLGGRERGCDGSHNRATQARHSRCVAFKQGTSGAAGREKKFVSE